MAKGFGEPERARIRGQLKQAAAKMLLHQSMRAISVDDLARAAFISKGAFYVFYPSKEALFLEVFLETERQFHAHLLDAADKPGLAPRARLIGVMQHTLTLMAGHPSLHTASAQDVELLLRKAPPDAVAASERADIALAAALMDCMYAHGARFCIDAQTLYRMFRLLLSLHLADATDGQAQQTFVRVMIEAMADRALC